MTLTLEINLDNAAFKHQGDEVARILRRVAMNVEKIANLDDYAQKVLDFDGNTVGKAEVIED